jgi:hypothetical protein
VEPIEELLEADTSTMETTARSANKARESDKDPEDEDRDDLRNFGFFTAQPFDRLIARENFILSRRESNKSHYKENHSL